MVGNIQRAGLRAAGAGLGTIPLAGCTERFTGESDEEVLGDRRFNGPTVSYRIALEDGDSVACTASNDDLLDRGTSVSLDVVATHRLRAFSPPNE